MRKWEGDVCVSSLRFLTVHVPVLAVNNQLLP